MCCLFKTLAKKVWKRGIKMFCKKCGNKLEQGAKFCPKCGNSVEVSEPAAVNSSAETPSALLQKGKSGMVWLWLGAFAVLLTMGIVILVVVLSGGEDPKDKEKDSHLSGERDAEEVESSTVPSKEEIEIGWDEMGNWIPDSTTSKETASVSSYTEVVSLPEAIIIEQDDTIIEDVIIEVDEVDPFEIVGDRAILVPGEDGCPMWEVPANTTLEEFLSCVVAKEGYEIWFSDGVYIDDMNMVLKTGMKFCVMEVGEYSYLEVLSYPIRVV